MRHAVDLHALLRVLHERGVEFIVVGGVGAALRGAPVMTEDLDIVHRRTTENVDRLLLALADLGATYRTHPHVPLGREVFEGPGHVHLLTRSGPLDVLGTIGDGLDHAQLAPDSQSLDVGDFRVAVLGLRKLIEIKEKLAREKDRAVLHVLRKTLEEIEGGSEPPPGRSSI